MLPDYRDINRRLGEPLWYDEHGVPRYDPFHPDLCGVYNDFVALMLVACQSCGRRFRVAWGVSTAASKLRHEGRAPRLPTAQDSGSFGYGDPPRHDGDGGRCPGETMTCDLIGVLQFWRDDDLKGWRRDPAHEVMFEA